MWYLGVPHAVPGGVARSVSVMSDGQREHIGSVIHVGNGFGFPVVSVREGWVTEALPRVEGFVGDGQPWWDVFQMGACAVYDAYVAVCEVYDAHVAAFGR